jgi:hypothetical protein
VTKPDRRWFRFSLRTLFAVVTVFCIVGGWAAYQLNWIRERQAFRESGKIVYAWGTNHGPDAPGMLWMFGETGESGLRLDVAPDDPELKRAQAMFPEAIITSREQ